jgi:esterase/lipase superfamily enzyme
VLDLVSKDGTKTPHFGSGRSPDLIFGASSVDVPKGHATGVIERPSFNIFHFLLGIEEKESEQFVLRQMGIMTKEEFAASIRNVKSKSALVFVHGFNVGFEDAMFRLAQIAFDAQYKGAPIAFSWPSKGSVASYDYDRESAMFSRDAFLQLIYVVQKGAGVSHLYVIAHSMGNQIVVDALAQAANNGVSIGLSEAVLAAPDIDKDVFINLAGRLKKVAKGITLYASSADKALQASHFKAGGPRAGEIFEDGPLTVAGMDSIDVTALGQDMFSLNHSTYSSERSAIGDISRIIETGIRPPNVRSAEIRPVPETGDPRYWRFPH